MKKIMLAVSVIAFVGVLLAGCVKRVPVPDSVEVGSDQAVPEPAPPLAETEPLPEPAPTAIVPQVSLRGRLGQTARGLSSLLGQEPREFARKDLAALGARYFPRGGQGIAPPGVGEQILALVDTRFPIRMELDIQELLLAVPGNGSEDSFVGDVVMLDQQVPGEAKYSSEVERPSAIVFSINTYIVDPGPTALDQGRVYRHERLTYFELNRENQWEIQGIDNADRFFDDSSGSN